MHPSARSITDVDVDLAPFNLPRQQAVADDVDGESVEAMLLRMLEYEENIGGFPSLSTMSQTHMHPSARSITDVDVDLAPFNLPRQQAVADDVDGESVEAMLLRMLEYEENIGGFPSLSTMSQVLGGNEHGPPVISGNHLQNLRPPTYVWDPDASASSSSLSSESTFAPSMTLDDEYFDPEALLRELAPSTEVSPRGSHQLLIQPPPSETLEE